MIPIAVLFMFAAGVCLAAQSTSGLSTKKSDSPASSRLHRGAASRNPWARAKTVRAETSSPEEDSISMCVLRRLSGHRGGEL